MCMIKHSHIKPLVVTLVIGLIIGGVTLAPSSANKEDTLGQPTNTPQSATSLVAESEAVSIPESEEQISQHTPGESHANAEQTPKSSPSASTPDSPEPTPEPQPITVASFQVQQVDEDNINCYITYSDGTDHTWLWKSSTYNQGQKTTRVIAKCDASIIGLKKFDNVPGYLF